MSISARPSITRRRRTLLAAVTLATSLLAMGTTAAVTAAGASASTGRTAEIAYGKIDKKNKPKPKPKPKPTTTVPSSPVTDETPPSGSVGISEEGSTLLLPLFELWSTAYHHQHSSVSLTPGGGGSGKGLTDAASGVVDIGASDAYLSSSQVSQFPGIKNIALAISAQMVNYNIPFFRGHIKLSGQVISAIYQGKITEWNDPAITGLNPSVAIPADKIVVLHRSDSSGDTFIFSSYLSAADPNGWGANIGYGTSISFPSIPNSLGESGNAGMLTGCQATPGCIAYIGVSYESKVQTAGLGLAALQNASGNYELPTPATIVAESQALEAKTPPSETLSMIYDSASSGYPIVNYEYGIIPPKESSAQVAQAVQAFLYWAVDPNKGSSGMFLNQVNFQPLTPAVRALSQKQIAQITG
jgi:phosphate transport system substrate-binding protein